MDVNEAVASGTNEGGTDVHDHGGLEQLEHPQAQQIVLPVVHRHIEPHICVRGRGGGGAATGRGA